MNLCFSQVFWTSDVGLNQVVAVDCGGDSNSRKTTRDELQHCHLCGGILHSNAIRAQQQVTLATIDFLKKTNNRTIKCHFGFEKKGVSNLRCGLVNMAVEDLFRECHWSV